MVYLRRPPIRRLDQFPCAVEMAQHPARQSKHGRCDRSRVLARPFPGLAIALRTACGERLLAMHPRIKEAAGQEGDEGETATRDAGLHDASPALCFAQESGGQFARLSQLAPFLGKCPLAMTGGETC